MDGRRLSGLARAAAMPGAPANDNVPGTITPDDVPFFLALGMICAAIVALAVYVGMSGPDDAIAALRGSMDEPPRYDGDARKAPPAYAGGTPGRDGDGVGHRAPSIKRSPARPGPVGGGSGRRVAVSTSGPSARADAGGRSIE